jgi:hypothetical protein
MRRALLLALAAPLLAQEGIEATLRLFAESRAGLFAPGAESRLSPLIERLSAQRDARVVPPLCEFIVETLGGERTRLTGVTAADGRRSRVVELMQQLEREVAHLRARERSGVNVGPDVTRCYDERRKLEASLQVIAEERAALVRAVDAARKLRELATVACAAVLRGLEGEDAVGAMARAREILGIDDRVHALLLVQILRESGNPLAEAPLLDVLRHAQAAPAVRAAASALAPIAGPDAVLVLLDVAERDAPPGVRAQVLHALGLRAQRQIETVAAAREWAKTLAR